jgi:hypothetical protein
MSKTIIQSKMFKLQSLQSIVELDEFLRFVESNHTYNSSLNKKVDNLINLWENSMPNKFSDPPCTWDDVITNRCIYYEYIEDKYYNSNDENNQTINNSIRMIIDNDNDDDTEYTTKKNIIRKLEKHKILMKIKFAQAAQIQGNYKLALNKLLQTREVCKNQNNHHLADLQLTWNHCYLLTHLARSKSSNSTEDNLNTFFSSSVLKEIVKYDNSQEFVLRQDLYQEHQFLHSEFCKFLIKSFIDLNNTGSYYYHNDLINNEKKRNQLKEYIKYENLPELENVNIFIFNLSFA